MVNFGNVLQGYLAATQQMLSGDQLNNTKMAITTYTLPALPYAYNVSRPTRCPNCADCSPSQYPCRASTDPK